MHKRGLCCHAVSVCLSVTFEDTVKTNKLIFKSFSPSGSKAILVIFLLEPHNRGVECRWGRQKSRFWAYIWLHCMLSTLRPARCYPHDAAGPRSRKLWHLPLIVSGRACWWQKMMMKCLWQEVLMLRRRQQNSALNCPQWEICSLHN